MVAKNDGERRMGASMDVFALSPMNSPSDEYPESSHPDGDPADLSMGGEAGNEKDGECPGGGVVDGADAPLHAEF